MNQRVRFLRIPVRCGVTLVEVLFAVAIISVLLAILLPAVQSARSASRRVGCANNLRQIALAVEERRGDRHEVSRAGTLPLLLAPYLENESAVRDFGGNPIFNTESSLSSVWECPADDVSLGPEGTFSYSHNDGLGMFSPGSGAATVQGRGSGVQRDLRSVWPDGRSQTALLSERVIFPQSMYFETIGKHHDVRFQSRRQKFSAYYSLTSPLVGGVGPWSLAPVNPVLAERIFLECRGTSGQIFPVGRKEYRRIGQATMGYSGGFTTVLAPNTADCYGVPTYPTLDHPAPIHFDYSLRPATSHHTGGVYLATADGATRFVNETIDLSVWSAIGTAAGTDVVGREW